VFTGLRSVTQKTFPYLHLHYDYFVPICQTLMHNQPDETSQKWFAEGNFKSN